MKFFSLFAIVCLVGYVAADDKQDQMDQLADQILGNLIKSSDLNPIHLHEDYEEPVDERFGPIHINGRLKLSKGILYGLNQMKRQGHCKITTDKDMDIAITMVSPNVTLDADISGHLNVLPLGFPSIPLIFHVEDLMFDIEIGVGLSDSKLSLKKFNTDEIDDVHVWPRDLDHFPLADTIVDALEAFFVKTFNRQIRDLINQLIEPILKEELKHIHI